jgi:predicted HicB family RNase H-like nuclease
MAKKAKKRPASKRVSRGSEQFMLRLPDGMRQRIADFAEAFGRSMNAEIVLRLEASFRADDLAEQKLVTDLSIIDTVQTIMRESNDRLLEEVKRLAAAQKAD